MTQEQALEILKSGVNVFLTGEPGAGKTFTINIFRDWLKERGTNYAVTASTGIASTHIGGTTIHSWSGIGVKKKIAYHHAYDLHPLAQEKIQRAKVLIIDEVSMLDAPTLDKVDFMLRALKNEELPFGGLQIVFVGDFFQLPPVSKKDDVEFAFEAESWVEAAPTVCYLTEQHRQSDAVFLDILKAMRNGQVTDEHKKILFSRAEKHSGATPSATQLYTHNIDVDIVNDDELRKLPGSPSGYQGTSFGHPKLVEHLMRNCLSPDILVLKVGARVMFTRNNFDAGYVNGTIGTITGFTESKDPLPIVLTKDGKTIIPNRAQWVFEEEGAVKASFSQIPLRLAWAITVHKSQGMSLDEASMDLSNIFEYGQGYVAISRVRDLAGLHFKGTRIHSMAFMMHPKVVEQDKIFKAENGVLKERKVEQTLF
jgi:ATP-dependent DNA helicase PIF1